MSAASALTVRGHVTTDELSAAFADTVFSTPRWTVGLSLEQCGAGCGIGLPHDPGHVVGAARGRVQEGVGRDDHGAGGLGHEVAVADRDGEVAERRRHRLPRSHAVRFEGFYGWLCGRPLLAVTAAATAAVVASLTRLDLLNADSGFVSPQVRTSAVEGTPRQAAWATWLAGNSHQGNEADDRGADEDERGGVLHCWRRKR